jgi:hypothetical protein
LTNRRLGAAGGLLLLAAAAATGDVVERRGAAPVVEGEVVSMDDAGVTLRSPLGAVHFVPWDRVRRVRTDSDEAARDRFMETAVDLWRARSRVERNDTTLAEPLLERLFEKYRGQTHETALVVAEGLLRCRIARADHVLAVVPALEVARLQRAGVTTQSYSTLPAVFDSERGLCTVLAPVWLPSPLLVSLAHDLEAYDGGDDEVVTSLARLYRGAVLRALGRPLDEAPPQTEPDHPGVELLRLLNGCSAVDADRRRGAREQLRRRIPSLPGWAEAWARFHVGRSLVGEEGVGPKHEGSVSLVHLPARFGRSQPFLAGLALAHVALALDQTGDSEDAARLRAELRQRYPRHPLHTIGAEGLRPLPGSEVGAREDHE